MTSCLKTLTLTSAPIALALAAMPVQAQIAAPAGAQLVAPQSSPASLAIQEATRIKEALVGDVYAVDSTDPCMMLAPQSESYPVLWRKTNAVAGQRMQVFSGDTGLVLTGRDMTLLAGAVLRLPGGQTVPATVVTRRASNAQCGSSAAVIRFILPTRDAAVDATLELTSKRIYPMLQQKTHPCTPANISGALEGGLQDYLHCFPDQTYPIETIPVRLIPRPSPTTTNLSSTVLEIGADGRIVATLQLLGGYIGSVSTMRLAPDAASAPGLTLGAASFRNGSLVAPLTWPAPVVGQVARGDVIPAVSVQRFPRSTGVPMARSREFSDTQWAGAQADIARSLGRGGYRITAAAAPPPPVVIRAYDPGNLLFNATGGTSVVGNGPGESQQVMSALASERWCVQAGVTQPAPGPNGVRTVAQGQTTLGPISWGIRNEGTTPFTGRVTAELRRNGTVVDTIDFNGTLAVNATQTKSFARPTTSAPVARESVGPMCYYLGLPSDSVLENSAYTIKVTTPGNNSRSLSSVN